MGKQESWRKQNKKWQNDARMSKNTTNPSTEKIKSLEKELSDLKRFTVRLAAIVDDSLRQNHGSTLESYLQNRESLSEMLKPKNWLTCYDDMNKRLAEKINRRPEPADTKILKSLAESCSILSKTLMQENTSQMNPENDSK